MRTAVLLLSVLAAGALAQVPEPRFEVERFVVEGDNPLGAGETQAVLAGYAGDYAGIDGLQEAAEALQAALAERGYSFHRVFLPPQTLDQGTVVLQVVVFVVGEVVIEGNIHFSDDSIRRALPLLREGDVLPVTRQLSLALLVANRHPDKTLAVNLRESKEPDAIDAIVQVDDARPWHAFININNIGTDETGRARVSAGFQYGDLFARDHIATLTYTTAPENTGAVQQWGFNYQLPQYRWHGWWSFFYIRSSVDTGQVADFFDISGAGRFAGVSFRREIGRSGGYAHAVTLGLQDRLFESDVRFLGVPIGSDVRSRPLSLLYTGEYRGEKLSAAVSAEYVHNLDGGADNSARAYAAFGADPDWSALRLSLDTRYRLPGRWSVRGRLRTQHAGERLIPGEQMGLGGAQSVRGFEERAIGADNGAELSFEVWTPPLVQGLHVLAFTDVGYQDLDDTLPGEIASDTIASAGAGVRWQWREYLSLIVDYGKVFLRAEPGASDRGNTRWHASLLMRY